MRRVALLISAAFASVVGASAQSVDVGSARVPIEIRPNQGDSAIQRLADETRHAFAASSLFRVVEGSSAENLRLSLVSQVTLLDHGERRLHFFIEARRNGRTVPVDNVECASSSLAHCAQLIVRTVTDAISGRPDLRQLPTFVRLERSPAFERKSTTLFIGAFQGDAPAVYWFKRELTERDNGNKHSDYTNTELCPQAQEGVAALEHLQMPQPDVPGVEPDDTKLIMDGVGYTLAGRSRHADGQPGDFKIESNVGSPLANWAEAMLKSLGSCWKPLD